MTQDPFARLRARFVERCREDRAALAALREDAGAALFARGSASRARVIEIAHRIAGGGGTFGYAALSEAAYRLDTSLIEAERDTAGGPGAAMGALEDALSETIAAAERA